MTATVTTTGPTTQGSVVSWQPNTLAPSNGRGGMLWTGLAQMAEHVPLLTFPQSIETYRRMRSDPRIQAVFNAWSLPIEQTKFLLDPAGSRPEVYRPIAEDLGIGIVGEAGSPRLRNRGRFRHSQHLHEALLMLIYGFQMFEIVGEYRNDGPGGRALWHMTKLAPVPGQTLNPLGVDERGDLVAIQQKIGMEPPIIPAEHLVPFVWGMEDGSWYGRSILRGAYQPWLIKDAVVRVVAEMQERNGMGLPKVKLPEGAGDPEQAAADALGANIRAGAFSHVTLPYGMDFSLEGVRGTLPDGKGFLDWLNREISAATLTGFLDMPGAKNGSLALASEIIDFFKMSQHSATQNYLDTMNDYVVERHVDINWGETEPAPKIIAKPASSPAEVLTPLYEAIKNGAVTVTPDIETYVREQVGADTSATPNAPEQVKARRRVAAAAGDEADDSESSNQRLPDRPLRRKETEQERRSQINLRALDDEWQKALAALLLLWGPIRSAHIDDVVAQVAKTHDPTELAAIMPDVRGADELLEAMQDAWRKGAEIAAGEIEAQGNTKPSIPSITKIDIPEADDAGGVTHSAALERMALADATGAAKSIANSASEAALHRAGGTLTADERAQQVRRLLGKLKGVDDQKRLGGSLSYAMHLGRVAVFQDAPNGSTYLADELLDDNTCTECIAIDQTEFATLDDALSAYPSQGFIDCAGQDRCRGQLAILTPASSSSDTEGDA